MRLLTALLERSAGHDDGQGVIEYTLVAGVISIGLYVAFTAAGIQAGIGRAVDAIVTKFP